MAVIASINTENISSRTGSNNRQHFQAASEFVTKAMKRAGFNIALTLYPKAISTLPAGTKHRVRSEGGQLKLTYQPNGGGSCWDYCVRVTSKPLTSKTYLDVEAALLDEVNRYENSIPTEHRPYKPTPISETIKTITTSKEPKVVAKTIEHTSDSTSAIAALDMVMKAAVRLDLSRQEIAELRKKLALEMAEQSQITARIKAGQDRIAELELAIEADPSARVALAFMETMRRMTA